MGACCSDPPYAYPGQQFGGGYGVSEGLVGAYDPYAQTQVVPAGIYGGGVNPAFGGYAAAPAYGATYV